MDGEGEFKERSEQCGGGNERESKDFEGRVNMRRVSGLCLGTEAF